MNAAMAVIQFREAVRNLEKRREIARGYTQSALRTRHRRFIQGEEYNNYAFPLVLETGLKDVKSYARKKDIVVESAFENTLLGFALTADSGAIVFSSTGNAGEGGEKPESAAGAPADGSGLQAGSRFQDLCPEAYSLSLRTVLFPLYPRLSSTEVERISKLIVTLP
jgi:dTDP-4-amino-4,6-dideoxygalactose transaminase